jgi:hypothetical protein
LLALHFKSEILDNLRRGVTFTVETETGHPGLIRVEYDDDDDDDDELHSHFLIDSRSAYI